MLHPLNNHTDKPPNKTAKNALIADFMSLSPIERRAMRLVIKSMKQSKSLPAASQSPDEVNDVPLIVFGQMLEILIRELRLSA